MPKKVVEVFYFIFILLFHSRRIKKTARIVPVYSKTVRTDIQSGRRAPAMDTAMP